MGHIPLVVASLHSCLEWVEIAYNSTVYVFLNGTCFILSNSHMKKTCSDSTPVISQKKRQHFSGKDLDHSSSSLISEVIDIRRMAAEWQMFFLHLFAHFWMKSR